MGKMRQVTLVRRRAAKGTLGRLGGVRDARVARRSSDVGDEDRCAVRNSSSNVMMALTSQGETPIRSFRGPKPAHHAHPMRGFTLEEMLTVGLNG
jgi:hypothetical protein